MAACIKIAAKMTNANTTKTFKGAVIFDQSAAWSAVKTREEAVVNIRLPPATRRCFVHHEARARKAIVAAMRKKYLIRPLSQ